MIAQEPIFVSGLLILLSGLSTEITQWLISLSSLSTKQSAGCRLGVGLGVGTSDLQVPEYQHDKSRVSRVSHMF